MSDFKPGAKVGRNTNPNFCCGLNESGRTCGFRNFKKAAFETHGKVVVQPPRTCRQAELGKEPKQWQRM
jgi:hypothetical protein